MSAAWQGLRLHQWLGRILRALRDAGVPVIPLKGAFLASQVYGNVGLRQMLDFDLLIHCADLARVEPILLSLDYSVDEGNSPESEERDAHRIYAPPKGGPILEVHWNPQAGRSPFAVDVGELWARAQPVTVTGTDALSLAPEDFLLHLCLHASHRHVFDFGLRPFCDIAETLRHYGDDLDWEQLVLLTRQWGASRCVHLTLYLAKVWLAAAVPEMVLSQLGPGAPDAKVLAWVTTRVFASQPAGEDREQFDRVSGPVSNPWARLYVSRNLLEKLRVFVGACFPPPKVLADKYALPSGSWRAYLYYPVHLRDLAVRHARRAWQLLHHDAEADLWITREAARIAREARLAEFLAMQEWLGAPDGQLADIGAATPPPGEI
jgi:hypothetical protein